MQTIQTILAPTDYSAASRQAMKLACDLARARQARVVALHAIEPPMYYGGYEKPGAPPASIRHELEAWAAQSRGPGGTPPVECAIVEGYATAEILDQARKRGCDLIVMGAAGRTGVDRLMLGNVAEQVARRAPCPVLLCKPPAASEETVGTSFATILVPTDLSEHASAALPVALALAGPETRLIALHVTGSDEPESTAAERSLEERFRTCVGVAARGEYRTAEGGPADAIVRAADEAHCDLIVMSSHGRTGLGRWLMGSVAESVFRSARCPVLIVRPTPANAEVAVHGA